jgi:hypothetical protein
MMRVFWILAAAALLALGCSDKSAQTTDQPEPGDAVGQDAVSRPSLDKAIEPQTQESAADDDVDPALRDFVYPDSELGGEFSMGNTTSLQYTTQDDYAEVVEYYKQKFPDTHTGSGTSTYFGKENPDGSNLTVTLTKLDSGTQIILKLVTQLQ